MNTAQYIDKAKVVAELEKAIDGPAPSHDQQCPWEDGYYCGLYKAESIIDTLEVKEAGDNSLEKFKSLQHVNKDLNKTLVYLGYAPNLYYFDGSWHVDWISFEEGDSIKGFTGDTADEVINKAYNWFHSTFCNG